jgi:hypothetical protein
MERNHLEMSAPVEGKGLQAGLAILLQAHKTGTQLRCPVAEVAPSWKALAQHGMTADVLATLLNAGHVELVADEGDAASHRRPLTIAASSRLGLTEQGVLFAHRMLGHTELSRLRTLQIAEPECHPHWDNKAGELWWKGECIRRFRHDASSQRRVLDALEEQGWPGRIDDPLPKQRDSDSKQRLRETIKSLNRGQRPVRLRFHCDGTGEGIRWEAIS